MYIIYFPPPLLKHENPSPIFPLKIFKSVLRELVVHEKQASIRPDLDGKLPWAAAIPVLSHWWERGEPGNQ